MIFLNGVARTQSAKATFINMKFITKKNKEVEREHDLPLEELIKKLEAEQEPPELEMLTDANFRFELRPSLCTFKNKEEHRPLKLPVFGLFE